MTSQFKRKNLVIFNNNQVIKCKPVKKKAVDRTVSKISNDRTPPNASKRPISILSPKAGKARTSQIYNQLSFSLAADDCVKNDEESQQETFSINQGTNLSKLSQKQVEFRPSFN